MADSSKNDSSSSKGFFFNRSILWKIVFVFAFIAMLSVIQFFLVSVSISTIDNEVDKSFRTISNQNSQAFLEIEQIDNATNIQREINDVISRLNTKIREIEGIYLGFIAGTNTVYRNQFSFVSTQIPTHSGELFDLIDSIVHPAVNNVTGKELINELLLEQDNFLGLVPSIFFNVPTYLISDIQESFTSFSNLINYKIANLLQWMYYGSNNTELFDLIKAESIPESSYALNINSTIANLDSDTQVYTDLIDFYNQIDGLYVSLFAPIDAIIAEVENKVFVVDNFDNTELATQIDTVVNITGQVDILVQNVATFMDNQLTLLNQVLDPLKTSFLSLETLLNALTDWSEDSSIALSARLDEIRDDTQLDLVNEINRANNIINSEVTSTTLILILVLVISVGIILSLLVISNYQISKPIKHISYWSEKISNQDLSYNDYKSKRTDEIGVLHNNFRIMNKNLKDIIVEVKDSSLIVSGTASELLSNTEEINATAEEVSAIAQSMAKGSTQQAELIATIVEELQITSETVDSVINQINYNLRIIHELSEQTNILALNTAIEAANAGEFGRGFAVISDNIRKMASQSKKTTEEVTRDSRAVLLQLQQTFGTITGKIENVAAVSEETAASAEEVAASAQELTAVMETVSAKSSVLDERSSQSENLVKNFVLDRVDDSDSDNGSKSNEEPQTKEI